LKRIATKTETNNLLPLEMCTVSYQPNVRHIKDEECKENTKMMRISQRAHVDNLPEIFEQLKKQRLPFMEVLTDEWPLPLECPVCHEDGSPIIIKERKANHSEEKWLKYNHTKGKPPCRIGKYKILKISHKDRKRIDTEIPFLILRKDLKEEDVVPKRKNTYRLSDWKSYSLK